MPGASSGDAASLIAQLGSALGAPPDEAAAGALGLYVELVERWNRKVNLTGARDAAALTEILLADALVLADPGLIPRDARVLDVGSGAGAPIVPLLLLRPDLSALCIEPLAKRAAFLRMLSARLSLLPRMAVRELRVDPDHPDPALASYDVALSRATLPPERWLRLGLLLAPRVLVLLSGAPPPQTPAGARLLLERSYALPFSGAPRRTCVYLRE